MSEYRKYGPEITPYLDTFHAVINSWTEYKKYFMEIAKQMASVERLFMFVHTISCKWVDGKSRTFQKITRTTLNFTLSIEFLRDLYATLIWQELDVS